MPMGWHSGNCGFDFHSDKEGLKQEHSLEPGLGGNDVYGKAEH